MFHLPAMSRAAIVAFGALLCVSAVVVGSASPASPVRLNVDFASFLERADPVWSWGSDTNRCALLARAVGPGLRASSQRVVCLRLLKMQFRLLAACLTPSTSTVFVRFFVFAVLVVFAASEQRVVGSQPRPGRVPS